MKKTGTLLKDKREAAGLTLSEVALATKINPKVLTAIENGDEGNLPAKTFLKGFVRSYALFLKMDVDEVLRSFQEETGGPTPERIHEAYKTDPNGSTPSSRRRVADENSSGMRTAAVVVIVLLIGLILGVRELIEKYQREKVLNKTEAAKVSPLAQPIQTETAVTTAPTTQTTQPPMPAPAAVAEKPPEVTKPAISTPILTPLPKIVDKPVEKPVEKPVDKPVEENVENSPAVTKANTNTKNEIILEALDNVDVKMLIKGETKKISLGPTQVHTIHTVEPVVFDFSDGGAVSIIVNGRERGPAGELGKPKQIKIP